LEERFRGRGYAALKAEVAHARAALTEPIRTRYETIATDGFRAAEEALRAGAAHTQALATETLARAKAAFGLLPLDAPRPDR